MSSIGLLVPLRWSGEGGDAADLRIAENWITHPDALAEINHGSGYFAEGGPYPTYSNDSRSVL